MVNNIKVIIPARGGSKGIPYKNIKELHGKPLIYYSIDVARLVTSDENICVTTEDDRIISCVESYGLKVPFRRPVELAGDNTSSEDVILHALNYYNSVGETVDVILLLQPTSPFRNKQFIEEAIGLYSDDLDMVVSVTESLVNPYYNCFEENMNGFLSISKGDGHFHRRQDAPRVYEYNGSIYVINPRSLKEKGICHFDKVKKYVMDSYHSIDLDTMLDWTVAESLLENEMIDL